MGRIKILATNHTRFVDQIKNSKIGNTHREAQMLDKTYSLKNVFASFGNQDISGLVIS